MGQALVPNQPTERDRAASGARVHSSQVHSSAGFITQLIATKSQAPQTRARRRRDPVEATDAYKALGQWPTPAGRVLARSL